MQDELNFGTGHHGSLAVHIGAYRLMQQHLQHGLEQILPPGISSHSVGLLLAESLGSAGELGGVRRKQKGQLVWFGCCMRASRAEEERPPQIYAYDILCFAEGLLSVRAGNLEKTPKKDMK